MVGTCLLDKHDLWAFHEDTGSEGASQIKCRFNLGYFHKGGFKSNPTILGHLFKRCPKSESKKKFWGEGGGSDIFFEKNINKSLIFFRSSIRAHVDFEDVHFYVNETIGGGLKQQGCSAVQCSAVHTVQYSTVLRT